MTVPAGMVQPAAPLTEAQFNALKAQRSTPAASAPMSEAEFNALKASTAGAGTFGAPSSPLQAHAQNIGHGVLGFPASIAAILPAIRSLGAMGGMNIVPQSVADASEAARKPLQDMADRTSPLTSNEQMGLANHPNVAGLLRFGEDAGGNALAGSAAGGLLRPVTAGAARFLSPAARVAATTTPEAMAAKAAAMQQAGRGGIMMGADLVPNPQGLLAANPQGAAALATEQAARAQEAPQRILSDLRSMVQAHAPQGTDPIADFSAKIKAMNPDASDADIAKLAALHAAGPNGAATPAPMVAAAIKAGTKAWHAVGPSEMGTLMQSLAPGEKDVVRQAVANQLVDQLENAGTKKDVAADLIAGARPGSVAQQKLSLLFGDKPTLDSFIQRMEVERAMVPGSNPPNHVVEAIKHFGSMLFKGSSFGGAVMHALPMAAANPTGAVGTLALGAIPAAVGAQNARIAGQIAPMMMRQGPDAIQSLIAQLSQSAPGALHPAVQAAIAGGAGQLGGRAGLLAPQGQAPGQATGLLTPPTGGP